MDIPFTCSKCGETLTAPEELTGQLVECPNPACGYQLTVPSEPPIQPGDITFDCPFCRHQLAVSKKGAGLEVACPECGKRIVVPKPATQTKPLAQIAGTNYFYADENRMPIGPYDAQQMQQFFQQGLLGKNAWVIEEGATEWHSYESLFLPISEAAKSGYQMKRCTSCGAEIREQAQFCTQCGTDLTFRPASKNSAPQVKRANFKARANELERPASDKSQRRKRSFLSISAISVGVLLIAGTVTCVRYLKQLNSKASAVVSSKTKESESVSEFKAFKKLQSEALRGNAEAQKKLGDIFASGQIPKDPSIPKPSNGGFYTISKNIGTPEELAKAIEWYQMAAMQGDVGAQFALGELLGKCRDTKGIKLARLWYLVASKCGHKAAPRALGMLTCTLREGDHFRLMRGEHFRSEYYSDIEPMVAEVLAVITKNGKYVSAREVEVFEGYKTAAVRGDPDAQFNLAVMHEYGIGVPHDMVQALAWYSVADTVSRSRLKESDSPLVHQMFAEAQTEDRNSSMTPKQISEAEILANELLKQVNKQ